jgi:hypothetical protein
VIAVLPQAELRHADPTELILPTAGVFGTSAAGGAFV